MSRPPTIKESDPVPGPAGVGLPSARWTTGSLGTVKSGTEVVGSDGAVDVVVVDGHRAVVDDVVVVDDDVVVVEVPAGAVDVVVVDGHVVVVDDDVPVVEVPADAWVRGAAAAPA